MKIAHLTTVDLSLRYLILPQLEAAARRGTAYGISAPGPHVSVVEEHGVIHVPLHSSTRGMSVVSDFRAMAELWKALKEIEPDVLHTHNPKPGVYGRILGRLAGVPIIVNTVHGLYATPDSSLSKRIVVYGLEAIASRFSDAELIQSPEDLDLLRRLHIVPSAKLQLLGNGVDLTRFDPARLEPMRREERARLGLSEDQVAVGMVGRLVAEKGILELVEAARGLPDNIRVFVAGPNDPQKDDQIAPSTLRDGAAAGVEFVGMRTDIDAFYSALDMFVLPSHREGFPRAAMEAAACGLPLVVTDIRGCRQVVDHDRNGLMVPVRDPLALREAISKLAADEERRARMRVESVAKAIAEFDEEQVVEIVMSTYETLARTKGLGWKMMAPPSGDVVMRPAVPGDAVAIAALHAQMIGSGFLSSLGTRFLTLLYGALIDSHQAKVGVAESEGEVLAYIAGTWSTSRFYKEFLRRHWFDAIWRMIPALLKPTTWRRVFETLSYGSGDESVGAELLAMAVAPALRRRGMGTTLVQWLLAEARREHVNAVKVVVGGHNQPAIRLYESCGFGDRQVFQVHAGEDSLELTWRS